MNGSSQGRKKISFKVEPVPAEQRDWLYSEPAKDAERGCIGHLRFDTGRSGKEFWTSWWPHNETLNRQPFKKELDQVVNTLRKKGNPLSDLYSMIHFCGEHGNEAALSEDFRSFGFKIETEAHEYLLRLTPFRGDYSYIYCYDKEAQRNHAKDQASVLKKLEELQPESESGPKGIPESLTKPGKEKPHVGKDAR